MNSHNERELGLIFLLLILIAGYLFVLIPQNPATGEMTMDQYFVEQLVKERDSLKKDKQSLARSVLLLNGEIDFLMKFINSDEDVREKYAEYHSNRE